jgi:hypothetical protein
VETRVRRAPFIAAQGGGRQNSGGRCSSAGSAVGASVRTGSPTGGSHVVSVFYNLSKTVSNCKIEIDSLSCSKNSNFCMTLVWNILNNFLN